jgi:2-amino-4-hydroxy-6-hydroxymethyldihydropteridine diphosphokinase
MSDRVYLGLGSNLGDRLALIKTALEKIQALPLTHRFQTSKIYETAPVSPIPQGPFLNAACTFLTTLSPFELLDYLQKIEKELGKTPKPKEAPRPIDIDILLFGQKQIDTPTLQIPHPAWQERPFVLIPLLDLTEEILLPSGEVYNLS